MPEDNTGYDVFLFPPAVEALGEAIKPYLSEGPAGAHIACRDVDTSGAFIELTIDVRNAEGLASQIEVMFPSNMVRLILSAHADGGTFGFGRRNGAPRTPAPTLEPGLAPAASP